MRVWDVAAGYLNRGSLLGEHRELHAVHAILSQGKMGYSRHPETLRWKGCLSALARRHRTLVAEMNLRGYADRTPLRQLQQTPRWPSVFITPAAEQYELLRAKYAGKEPGRIAVPKNCHELWAQHKYSILARDPAKYRSIGRTVSRLRRGSATTALAHELALALREAPPRERTINAIEHLWGHVSADATSRDRIDARKDPATMLRLTQQLARGERDVFLLSSTALSELMIFIGPPG